VMGRIGGAVARADGQSRQQPSAAGSLIQTRPLRRFFLRED
jgi:hypothetical protein